MAAIPSETDDDVERSVQRYRRLLVLYPSSLREEFGEDMAQSYRDLVLFSTDGRGVWWRTTRDLVVSAARERAAMFSKERRPSYRLIIAIAVITAAVILIGGMPLPLLPAVTLVALPLYGFSRFWCAWTVRRTTGGTITRQLVLGVVSMAPAAVFLAVFPDAGYWVFMAVSGTLIVSAALGIIWAVVTLIRRPQPGAGRRWITPVLIIIPSVAVLTFIIGASLNSYLRTIGPAGDHSVQNASADTRELWVAAGAGELTEVTRITDTTCADPWVRFTADEHGNQENARGHAIVKGPHKSVERILDDYMGDWYERCGQEG